MALVGYFKANGDQGQYSVIRVTDDPAYTVVAVCDDEGRASQIASLLTADEA